MPNPGADSGAGKLLPELSQPSFEFGSSFVSLLIMQVCLEFASGIGAAPGIGQNARGKKSRLGYLAFGTTQVIQRLAQAAALEKQADSRGVVCHRRAVTAFQ